MVRKIILLKCELYLNVILTSTTHLKYNGVKGTISESLKLIHFLCQKEAQKTSMTAQTAQVMAETTLE
jgi:hypothetical protein